MERAEEFFDTTTLEKAEQLTSFVQNEKPFSFADVNVPENRKRMWFEFHYVPQEARQERFGLISYVWCCILKELQELHYPWEHELLFALTDPIDTRAMYERIAGNSELIEELPLVETEKEKLRYLIASGEWKAQVNQENQFCPLLLIIAEAISKRACVSIAVFREGEFIPLVDSNLHLLPKEAQHKLKTETHLTISITKVLSSVIGNERFGSLLSAVNYFHPDELELLRQIRSGEYDSIKIRFQNKRMNLLELEKHEDVHKRIVDILAEGKFQSISISQQHGKINRVTRSVKIRFDK